MKVLLTGASSFTGLWFAEALVRAGAIVTAPLRGRVADYEGVRSTRVKRLMKVATVVESVEFGGTAFLSLIEKQSFDILCHHAAQVTNYRSLDFDVGMALAENTRSLRFVLEAMRAQGVKGVVATGSVFEQDEGIGETPLLAFSPYGLSKGLTWQVIRYWCTVLDIPLGKFVIPNPFGPYEEARFGTYLMNCWRKRDIAEVRTPAYLRDNIHVDLLALAYARFTREIVDTGRSAKLGPSGYRETQGAFTERFAREMRSRLRLDCGVRLADQHDFPEPHVRLNSDTLVPSDLGWDEAQAWDKLAAYYAT